MAARTPSQSLTEVVATGDTRRSLEALRDRIAVELESASGAPVAALAKQLADVLKAIAEMPDGKERSIDDDLAERRKIRRATAGASKRAKSTPNQG